jgi:predicted enzyme related to lactoylglutathione lyase
MSVIDHYPPNTFCWVDLATTDVAAAKAFYTSLFGWTADDMPADEGAYTMVEKDGDPVCGVYAMDAGLHAQGVPPHWASYVSVEDADAMAARAQSLGGAVLVPAFDVMDAGRMAVLSDPQGAAFALWQPRRHIGATRVDEPGAFCWNELYTTDVRAAAEFYSGLFGWTTREDPGVGGATYHTFVNGERMAAGMLAIRAQWGEVQPNWGVYFTVEDCDGTLSRLAALGGVAVTEPMEVAQVGRFALVRDPQGAHFSVIQLTCPPD